MQIGSGRFHNLQVEDLMESSLKNLGHQDSLQESNQSKKEGMHRKLM